MKKLKEEDLTKIKTLTTKLKIKHKYNKNKYDFIIIKQRYKILNAFKEIVNFIQTNNIPLYSLSAMEIIFNKYIN